MTRRRIVIALSSVAGLLVLALIAATVLSIWSVRRPFPEYDGSATVPRLSGDAEIVRDQHGIPHIYADTPEDLFRAQAYAQAQDRFWQMDFRRHVTAGRLSELFGPDQVETDTFVRTLGWRRTAEQELPLIKPETRRYLEAYADGVNAWLDHHSGGDLGLAYTLLGLTGGDDSPEDWTAVDSLSWLKAMAWDLRGNLQDEISRALLAAELPIDRVEQLYPGQAEISEPIVDDRDVDPRPPEAITGADGSPVPVESVDSLQSAAAFLDSAPALLGAGDGIGSNSWVVGGTHTESGTPLLANDPHLAPTMPSTWYQVGLHCRDVGPECPFDVVGYSFAGLPGVVIGHNQDVAWGFTNLGPDVSDLYLEQVRGDTYRVGDSWEPMQTREETIEVAGGDDVTITVRSTRHGPVLSDHDERIADVGDAMAGAVGDDRPPAENEYAVALRWTALDPGRTADALFALNRAHDWASFRAAASWFEVPAQNLVYADVNGNIGYQAPGRIPVRDSGDGRYPVPGWTDEHEWAGFIPFDELPSVLNPQDGYIVTANQPVTSDRYPFLLTADFDAGQRAGRIDELLSSAIEAEEPITADVMTDIQMDTHSELADILVPYLSELDAPDGYYGDGLRLLDGWDHAMDADSAAAAYFNVVWRNLLELTFHDELPEDTWPRGDGRWFEVVRNLLERPDDPYWDDVRSESVDENRDLILIEAVRDARNELTALQGKDASQWEWGRLHALTLTEQTFGTSGIGPVEALFNRGPLEVGGGTSIVQATGWDTVEGYETVWAPSMRMIVNLGDLGASRWIDLTGVSGHPYHEHYGDQAELWRTGGTLPMRWGSDAVRDAAEHTFTLSPPDTESRPPD
ncbi:penicillin amidase [Haloactinopolyspora alba]|uniref:Penicillin amidase n=1 Tax=Haloactinopolyspora alba TaxID=648780 RepID=A0A2P8E558_9ACTN|nr:penicillin acylase family protein [Haloactinopolyspora alba]PSL04599.1 penicillin amidase [Haloactinopolyspora alba]